MWPQIRIYDMDKSILSEREPGAPAHAMIAASVARAYDLLAADNGPQTADEWEAVTMILTSAGIACEMASADQEKERAARPNPRMVDGCGVCSSECPLFRRESQPDVGWCYREPDHAPTRDGAYCGVWVDEKLRREQESDEQWQRDYESALKERDDALRKLDAVESELDSLRAWRHAADPERHAVIPAARPVDANTAAIIAETERRTAEKVCGKCRKAMQLDGRWWKCTHCNNAFLAMPEAREVRP
jgi:hypothetical protein